MKKLKTKIDEFHHIIHVADIHIRLNKRIEEYTEVFETFYKEIDKSPEDTIVFIAGDLLHNKADLSPECIQLAGDFLCNCEKRRPTILISGNHDALLSNRNRLDSLTPIVKALNLPNLYYLRNTDLYGIGNVLFNVMGVFSEPEEYITFDKIPKVYKNEYSHFIATYHGTVNNAMGDLGFVLTNKLMPIEIFDGHHIALLGDIHKSQDMQQYDFANDKPIVRYPGSLIMQNHSETNNPHGYTLWDLDNRTYNHIEIPNEYGFFTIEVDKGVLITDISQIPKKARLRVKCNESVASEVKDVLNKVKESTSLQDEVVYVRLNDNKNATSSSISVSNLSNLTDINYQEKLLSQYLTEKVGITDQTKIDIIFELNKKVNNSLDKKSQCRNIIWKPKLFEFDNMFSYGEGNIIDFTKMSDIVGIFASNTSGKSSIFSSLSFCIFDKFERGSKGVFVLNAKKSSFRCKFNFEIDGVDYFIERKGKADKKGNVKVDVNFWKVENGAEISLNGEQRDETNKQIREYVGEYEDFIITSLSVQNVKNAASFVDMGNADRKDLLAQFLGLNIYDQLLEKATDEFDETTTLLKSYKNSNYGEELIKLDNEYSGSLSMINDLEPTIQKLSEQRDEINSKILSQTQTLVKVEGGNLDLNKLQQDKNSNEQLLKKNEFQKKEYNNDIELLLPQIQSSETKLTEWKRKNISDSYKQYQKFKNELNHIENQINLKKSEVMVKVKKMDMLKKHEYDPNCKFCITNPFVKDAQNAQSEIEKDKTIAKQLGTELVKAKENVKSLEWVVSVNDEYNKDLTENNKLKNSFVSIKSQITNCEREINNCNSRLDTINKNIEIYNKEQYNIERNKQINSNIHQLNIELSNLNFQLNQKNKYLQDFKSKIEVLKFKMQECQNHLDKIKELESLNEYYSIYLKAVGRDGIPYEIIASTVPKIEQEINTILTQFTDFTLSIETDGKNITPYINYEEVKWPIELSSGYERFVSSLVIRTALINVSNLPRPNFIAVDEGFGVLDADNLSLIKTLFDVIKQNFDSILIISHLESLKDIVNKTMEINKTNGFSHIEYK